MLLRPATSVRLVSTSSRQKRIQSIILIRMPDKGVYQSPRTYWFPLKIKHLGSHAESCWHIHQTRLEWAVHQLCESPVSTSYFLLWTIGQFHIVILCSHGDFHDYDNPQYVIKPTAFFGSCSSFPLPNKLWHESCGLHQLCMTSNSLSVFRWSGPPSNRS